MDDALYVPIAICSLNMVNKKFIFVNDFFDHKGGSYRMHSRCVELWHLPRMYGHSFQDCLDFIPIDAFMDHIKFVDRCMIRASDKSSWLNSCLSVLIPKPDG